MQVWHLFTCLRCASGLSPISISMRIAKKSSLSMVISTFVMLGTTISNASLSNMSNPLSLNVTVQSRWAATVRDFNNLTLYPNTSACNPIGWRKARTSDIERGRQVIDTSASSALNWTISPGCTGLICENDATIMVCNDAIQPLDTTLTIVSDSILFNLTQKCAGTRNREEMWSGWTRIDQDPDLPLYAIVTGSTYACNG